ncbi:MAG: acyltransferase protein [Cyanobacteria bacterium RYN_339]|nr:acyltransferase protein [Cyanobacteria bacterium RYN_339]
MTEQQIKDWLVAYVAKELQIAPSDLDPEKRLFDLGLTSRQSVLLAGDLEDWLGVEISPDLTWDHPTIAALAAHLGAPA